MRTVPITFYKNEIRKTADPRPSTATIVSINMSSSSGSESLAVIIDCNLDSSMENVFANYINAILVFLHAYTATNHNQVRWIELNSSS